MSLDTETENALLQEVTHYWDGRAESYSQANIDELHCYKKEAWLKIILENAPKKEKLKVLDVGTGPGFFAIIMAQAGHQVVAVDATPNMLKEAQENACHYGVEIQFVHHDVQILPFADNSFDLILSRNVTWNLDKPEQAYREWLRVLSPEGKMINFDANWYLYLSDEKLHQAFLQDRENTRRLNLTDYYANPRTKIMEDIARHLPLSREYRPQWDKQVLEDLGCSHIHIDTTISEYVWDQEEKVNSQSTPLFMIVAEK